MSITDTLETTFLEHRLARKPKGRRLSLPISPKLQAVIDAYRASYPNKQYSETAVLSTFIQAGAKAWAAHIKASREQEQ